MQRDWISYNHSHTRSQNKAAFVALNESRDDQELSMPRDGALPVRDLPVLRWTIDTDVQHRRRRKARDVAARVCDVLVVSDPLVMGVSGGLAGAGRN
jgi:hypothetical protein